MCSLEKNYTPAQVAEILQVKDVTVRRWRVTESDLKAFIEDHRPKQE